MAAQSITGHRHVLLVLEDEAGQLATALRRAAQEDAMAGHAMAADVVSCRSSEETCARLATTRASTAI